MAPKCLSCGSCCLRAYLTYSPATLRNSYVQWRNQTKINKYPCLNDIWLIYPMWAGRCLGKTGRDSNNYYIYGPCTHLVKNPDDPGKYRCRINDIKPQVCREFPHYGLTIPACTLPRKCGFWKSGMETTYPREKLIPLSRKEL